jgi:hypothetical protein
VRPAVDGVQVEDSSAIAKGVPWAAQRGQRGESAAGVAARPGLRVAIAWRWLARFATPSGASFPGRRTEGEGS